MTVQIIFDAQVIDPACTLIHHLPTCALPCLSSIVSFIGCVDMCALKIFLLSWMKRGE